MLEVQEIVAGYGEHIVLKGVSLTVGVGELLGLIGPNGSGKSTLLRVVTAVIKPRSGRVLLLGSDANRLSRRELARRVAMVPQNPALPEAFAAWEAVLMGRNPHLGLLQSESRADLEIVRRAMEQTNTWHLAERRMGELSGGERQRVVLARALAQQTPVMLLDEPTANLDIGHQMSTFELVLRLCRTQSLVVLATVHDLTLAAQFCDRLALLDGGRIVATGTPEEIMRTEVLAPVYRTGLHVLHHPVSGRPVVAPSPLGAENGSASAEQLSSEAMTTMEPSS